MLQNDPSLRPKDRLIFALDYPGFNEAKKAVTDLSSRVGLFKVGLELFVSAGPAILEFLADNDAGIFLDLKFHDIPQTVRAAVKAAEAYKVRFVSVHASEGASHLKAAVQNLRKDTGIIAVTLLTSLSSRDMGNVGLDKNLSLSDLAVLRARMAYEAGCAGVVCSVEEVRRIKQEIGKNLIAVVPGIRPKWSSVSEDDQKRISTPGKAVLNGADYIVVGRPIRQSTDPAMAADRIVEEIESTLREGQVQN